ncbi:STAS domain-containing protein [Nocardia suismassiliense]|uniref:STAS domain-containing protein n=1 Tax=Nocardia suismassiliense TaxID=2077092 RepID=A0ABW6R8J0_9NOCA
MSSSSAILAVAPRSQRYVDLEPGEVRCFPLEQPPRVAMRGDIDLTAELQLDMAYQELAQLAPADVIIDLAEVTFVGCVALRLLVALTARLTPTGHKLTILSPSPPARRLLELAGFL